MTKYKGYTGTLLRINLTTKKFRNEKITDDLVEQYLGGEGFSAKILWDELEPCIEPLSPANKIVFALGPLAGTRCPSVSRLCAATKSPLTNGFTKSLAAGHLPYELKHAGYDAIVIEGKSTKPIYIWIRNGKVQIRDANFLWGLSTGDTEKFVKNHTNQNAKVLCIGPGGENLVKFACIMAGIGAFGRGGLGAVMGSKNLKAIAVRGTKNVKLSNPNGFDTIVRKVYANMALQKAAANNWRLYGTLGMVDIIETHGNWPTRNFQSGVFPSARRKLYKEALRKNVLKINVSCTNCPVLCKKIAFVDSTGPFAGVTCEGYEYETVWAFGSQIGNSDPKAIVAADKLCDDLGLDTISCGNTIGFAMELYQNKIIKPKDAVGIKLKWGNIEATLETINKIAFRSGIGGVLAEGVKRASKKIGKGAEKYAMHVKGLELPAYDPRGQFGMGLNYATANKGGDHCSGYTTYEEVIGPINRFSARGKGNLVYRIQNETCVKNSAILCTFGEWGTHKYLSALIKTTTGLDFTKHSVEKIGGRIFNLERAFNIREGFTAEDDTLPERLLTKPLRAGQSKGYVVDLKPMLKDYYKLRGWDKKGIPTRKKLEKLGLNDVADELVGIRKLTK